MTTTNDKLREALMLEMAPFAQHCDAWNYWPGTSVFADAAIRVFQREALAQQAAPETEKQAQVGQQKEREITRLTMLADTDKASADHWRGVAEKQADVLRMAKLTQGQEPVAQAQLTPNYWRDISNMELVHFSGLGVPTRILYTHPIPSQQNHSSTISKD